MDIVGGIISGPKFASGCVESYREVSDVVPNKDYMNMCAIWEVSI